MRITRPVDILWQTLRDNETRTRRATFVFIWADAKWASDTDTEARLDQLYKQHGPPVETRITDNLLVLSTYRCNLCGGLVQFDGTPPKKDEKCLSQSAVTG